MIYHVRCVVQVLKSGRIAVLPESSIPFDYDVYHAAFIESYKQLRNGEPISRVPEDEAVYGALQPPQLVIVDVSLSDGMKGSSDGVDYDRCTFTRA